jgi:hypothetical protein
VNPKLESLKRTVDGLTKQQEDLTLELQEQLAKRAPLALTSETRGLNKDAIDELDQEIKSTRMAMEDNLENIKALKESLLLLASPELALSSGPGALPKTPAGPQKAYVTSLPKIPTEEYYEHGKTKVHDYLSLMEARLIAHGTSKPEWYRIFGTSMKGKPLKWVSKRILSKEIKDWKKAREIFENEFLTEDFQYNRQHDLLQYRQGKLSAADFFRELEDMTELADVPVSMKFFMIYLFEVQLNDKYKKALVAQMGKRVRTATFEELKEQASFLDSQELSHYDSTSRGNAKAAASSDRKNDKTAFDISVRCDICHRKGHTTENHRGPQKKVNPEGSQHKNSNSNGNNKPSRSNATNSTQGATSTNSAGRQTEGEPLTCYNCGQAGHKKDKCPLLVKKYDVKTMVNRLRALRAEKLESTPNWRPLSQEDLTQAVWELEVLNNAEN